MPWPCFVVERSGRSRATILRYRREARVCARATPGAFRTYCRAELELGDFADGEALAAVARVAQDDKRWPKACAGCGGPFAEDDPRTGSAAPLYRAADGREFPLRDAPVGALWRATWLEEVPAKDWLGPDGQSWVVKLPGGSDWAIDSVATGGGRWTRTGVAPAFDVNPSILVPGYHGYLRHGTLTDPI